LSLDQLLRQHLQSMSEVLSPQQRPGGFGEFARLATAYIWTMDTLVIPALAQAGWRGVRVDHLAPYAAFKQAFAGIVPPPSAQGEQHRERRAALRQALDALVEAHRGDLGKALAAAGLNDDALTLLAAAQAFEGPPRSTAPLDTSGAAALVADAAVVLKALRTQGSERGRERRNDRPLASD
jgi:hypothetical protein